jgi:signal transduction histidine kinase
MAERGTTPSQKRTLTWAVGVPLAIVALALGASAVFGQEVRVHPEEGTHVAIQTSGVVVLCLAAILVFVRYHLGVAAGPRISSRDGGPQRVADLALAPTLGFLALCTLAFSTIPLMIVEAPGPLVAWAQTIGSLAGVAIAALAASISTERWTRSRLTPVGAAVVIAFAMLATLVLAVGADALLPTPRYHVPGALVIWLPAQIATVLGLAVAFAGFARRAARTGDRLMQGLAIGAALGAGAIVVYSLGGRLGPDWALIEELLLLGAYIAVFAGAWRETSAHYGRLVDAVVRDERRRIARDLHDGISQELVYITQQARGLAERNPEQAGLHRLAYVSERALAESRGAIGTLMGPLDEPLAPALERVVREVAERSDATALVHARIEAEPPPKVREAVLWIAREATLNAVRHGGASVVAVDLAVDGRVTLHITDDGTGFDAHEGASTEAGFGLVSMRERAAAFGGTVVVESEPGAGADVTVALALGRARVGTR